MRTPFVTAWALLAVLALGCNTTSPGTTCRTNDDCKSLKGGWCAKVEICTRACDDSAVCPSGSVCVTEGQRRVCLQACTKNEECPKGFQCNATADGQACEVTDPFAKPAD